MFLVKVNNVIQMFIATPTLLNVFIFKNILIFRRG